VGLTSIPDPRYLGLAWIWHACQTHVMWTWLTAKSMHFELDGQPSPNILGLAIMSDSRHFRLANRQMHAL